MTDPIKDLAEAGATVLGGDTWTAEPAARPGNYLFLGSLMSLGLVLFLHTPGWLAAVLAFFIGAVANEREARQIKRRIAEREMQHSKAI